MRILVTIGGYIPAKNYGGPVVSINNLCALLQEEWEIYILTVDHDINSTVRFANINEGWNDIDYIKVMYLRENEISYNKIKMIVNDISPDLIYVNSIFLAKFILPFFRLCEKLNIPLLIAPRGELCKQPYSVKRIKKLPYTFLIRNIYDKKRTYYQATSEEERQQIKRILKVNEGQIILLDNIPSIPNSKINKYQKKINSLRCIFFSRIHPKKNLLFALQVLREITDNVTFDIYGNIEDHAYWKVCEEEIRTMPANIKVNYLGSIEHDEFVSAFSQYDIMLFPTKSENYGHVIAEAMLSLCPVIISDQTPWNDINDVKAGWAISLDRKDLFIDALKQVADMGELEYSELVSKCEQYISNKINISKLKLEYRYIFKRIIATSRY